jgi:hypothetical protein
MTDEIKLKAECRNKINRAGLTMIAEKTIENQLADNSSNQRRDLLSALRTSPLFLLFFQFFHLLPFSSQIES